MRLLATDIDGVLVVEPELLRDGRGWFAELFSSKVLPFNPVQMNESRSRHGVVRGLHFQEQPFAQAKLVRCTSGRIIDVAVDMRPGSPSFGRSVRVELSARNRRLIFIPKGFAHGFSVLSSSANVQYLCDVVYHPEADGGINPLDPALGIDWGLPREGMILKEKDLTRPYLKDLSKL